MKIIHTSDWHLGQTLHGHSRNYEHFKFLSFLKKYICENNIDALFITGDVFHTYMPANNIERIFSNYLNELREVNSNIQVIVIAGNHDGAYKFDNMGKYCSLGNGIYIIGSTPRNITEEGDYIDVSSLIIPLKNKDGRVVAYVAAVPYERSLSRCINLISKDDNENPSDEKLLQALYEKVYKKIAEINKDNLPVLALGHATFIKKDSRSHECRELEIGGIDAMDASVLQSQNYRVDYIALGHIHKSYNVDVNCRYAGSPIPMNKSEINQKQEFSVIDINEHGIVSQKSVEIPRFVEFISIPESGNAKALEVYKILDNLPRNQVSKDERPFLNIEVFIPRNGEVSETDKSEIRSKIKEKLQSIEDYYRLCNFSYNNEVVENLSICDDKDEDRNIDLHDIDPKDFLEMFVANKNLTQKSEQFYEVTQDMMNLYLDIVSDVQKEMNNPKE
ncbi:MAG: exonuclease SbcCD subunit D [Succinivibrionaceae bacterium]